MAAPYKFGGTPDSYARVPGSLDLLRDTPMTILDAATLSPVSGLRDDTGTLVSSVSTDGIGEWDFACDSPVVMIVAGGRTWGPITSAQFLGEIATAVLTMGLPGGGGGVGPGEIGTTELADGSVTLVKLATAAVGAAKLAVGAVLTDALADLAVTGAKIADNTIGSAKIADGAITGAKLGTGAVTETKIGNAAVTGAKIADGAITPQKLDRAVIADPETAPVGSILTRTTDGWIATAPGPDDFVLVGDSSDPTRLGWAPRDRRKSMTATVGDGTATEYPITHGWGTKDVAVSAYLVSTGEDVIVPVVERTPTSVVVGFGAAPAAASVRVLLVEVA